MATDKSKVGRKKDEKSCERHNIISFAMCIDVFFARVRVLILKKQQDRVRERESGSPLSRDTQPDKVLLALFTERRSELRVTAVIYLHAILLPAVVFIFQ